jgi:sorbitol-specific phosphotransferase system component IIA
MAGRIQMLTSGSQDRYFTRNPDYSHFVEAFKKHANFSTQYDDLDPENEADFGKKIKFKIPQNQGDLLKTLSVKMTLPEIPGSPVYVESVGHAIIDHVDLIIGGTIVQRLHSDYLQIYSEHNVTQTKQKALEQLIGKYSLRTSDKLVGEVVTGGGIPNRGIIITGTLGASSDENFFVDLPFYFYKHPELAIPLCAINKQEVEVEITLRKPEEIMVDIDGSRVTSPPAIHIKDFKLSTEVVFLDKSERSKMQKMKKDYIITQLQQNVFDVGVGINEGTFNLDFRNPVKELYFVIQRQGTRGNGVSHGNFVTPFDYDNTALTADNKRILYENLNHLTLKFDGEDIITEETGNVLMLKAVQAAIHHSKTQLIRRFYSYSFALQPEEAYPTGQVNMSNVKEQILHLSLTSCPDFARQIRVYAVNHNILRVGEGIAQSLFTLKY